MLNLTDKLILCYYFIINLLAYTLYQTDKQKAKKQLWRIPEKTLFLTAFLGGAFGALIGMQVFHHTTQKNYFCILNLLALGLHLILMYFLLFRLPEIS